MSELMDLPGEVWKDIEGYEGLYQVSNIGRVRSSKTGNAIRQNSGEYLTIYLNRENKGKGNKFSVHRLVATAFIPNSKNKPQVNHIDGDKHNNKVCNLEWVTAIENSLHAHRTGLVKRKYSFEKGHVPWNAGKHWSEEHRKILSESHIGKQKYGENPKARPVLCVETGIVFPSISAAMEYTGASRNISACCRGITKTCGGFHWRYSDE